MRVSDLTGEKQLIPRYLQEVLTPHRTHKTVRTTTAPNHKAKDWPHLPGEAPRSLGKTSTGSIPEERSQEALRETRGTEGKAEVKPMGWLPKATWRRLGVSRGQPLELKLGSLEFPQSLSAAGGTPHFGALRSLNTIVCSRTLPDKLGSQIFYKKHKLNCLFYVPLN